MAEIFYNLLNSTAFWVTLALWVFVCIAWTERWKPVLNRISLLLIKPIIFRTDPHPDVPFYPRSFLEDSANGFRDTLKQPLVVTIEIVSGWCRNLASLIYSKYHPFRTLGYFLLLICFLFFVLADSISVANTLVALGLWVGALPPFLSRLDLAIFGGSLLALIIGMSLVFEIRSDKSEFSQWSDRDSRTRALSQGVALLVTLLSLITLITWAFFRLIEIGLLNSNPTLDILLNLVLFGIVPINSGLAASITFLEAQRGFIGVLVLLGWILILIMQVVNYAVTIIGSIMPFLFDIGYRLIYISLDILQWFISTPIQAIIWPFRKIGETFTESVDESTMESKRQKK